MERKLIFKNVKAAQELSAKLERIRPKMEQVYDLIRALDPVIDPNMAKLSAIIVDKVQFKKLSGELSEFIQDAIIEKAGEIEFNGVKFDRDRLKTLLSFPSFSHINAKIDSLFSEEDVPWVVDIVQYLKPDQCSFVDNCDELICSKFEYYTKTKKANDVLDRVSALVTALNDLNQFLNGNRDTVSNLVFVGREVNATGVKFDGKKFVVDHSYILSL